MLFELRSQYFTSERWNERMTVTEYLQGWLQLRKKEIAPTTYVSYLQTVRGIVAFFQDRNLQLISVSPNDIESFYQSLYERELSSNSVLHYHTLLHKACADAARRGLIQQNPMEKVQRPSKGNFVPHPYVAGELKELFSAIAGHELEVPIKLAAYYGLRRSEVLGLRWGAVNFEQGTISIEHTVVEVPKEVLPQRVVGRDTVKRKSSNRTLPMTPEIQEMLRTYREHANVQQGQPTEYLFTDKCGAVIRPSFLSSAFSKILKENNLRPIRFHDLRHSSAGILIANRVPLVEVQQWLGHSTIRVTADLYTHLEYEIKKRSAAVMSDILF